jgi:hypothetical protein
MSRMANWHCLKVFLLLFTISLACYCSGGGGGGSSPSGAGTIAMAWDLPATNVDGSPLTDLGGYKLYYGTASGIYDYSVDVGNVTIYTLTGLTRGQTYYIALTAYDISNNESDYSNEVSKMTK